MEREIEETFGEVVAQLRAAPGAHVSPGFAAGVMVRIHAQRLRRRISGWLALAASLAVAAGYAFLAGADSSADAADLAARQRADGGFAASSAAPYLQAFAVRVLANDPTSVSAALSRAVAALARSQRADGGWGNAVLTQRNAAALRAVMNTGDRAAACAYRRAARYLRLHGLSEPTDAEFAAAARDILARHGASMDAVLLSPVALCAK